MNRPNDAEFELMLRDPKFFRDKLRIDIDEQKIDYFGKNMAPFQREVFSAKDECYKWLAGRAKKPLVRRFWDQRARGHSKTSDEACSLTWLLLASTKPVEGICVAEDKQQAGLMWKQMCKLRNHNPWLNDFLHYRRNVIRNRLTGAELQIWSSDVDSSWGMIPDFVVADEITHWSDQAFWVSVFSSFEKRNGMLSILCNAGSGRDWKWQIKQGAIESNLWFHFAPEGCVAPWVTGESLDEQRRFIPYNEFARLWLNIWQESGGEFVTLQEAKRCERIDLVERYQTQNDGWPYVASLDYAEKRDRTVGTVIHQEGSRIIVDRMDVICPTASGKHTRVSWCENWMINVQQKFGAKKGAVYFVIDKYQLLGVKERLEDQGFQITEFEFASGLGNYRMGMLLRQLILNEMIGWYSGCGKIVDGMGSEIKTALEHDDFTHELADLVVVPYANGKRWRFDHQQDQIHHDDRAYAVGAGCLFIVENSGGFEEWGFVDPNRQSEWRLAS